MGIRHGNQDRLDRSSKRALKRGNGLPNIYYVKGLSHTREKCVAQLPGPNLMADNVIVVHVGAADRAQRVGPLENVGALFLVEGKRRLEELAWRTNPKNEKRAEMVRMIVDARGMERKRGSMFSAENEIQKQNIASAFDRKTHRCTTCR